MMKTVIVLLLLLIALIGVDCSTCSAEGAGANSEDKEIAPKAAHKAASGPTIDDRFADLLAAIATPSPKSEYVGVSVQNPFKAPAASGLPHMFVLDSGKSHPPIASDCCDPCTGNTMNYIHPGLAHDLDLRPGGLCKDQIGASRRSSKYAPTPSPLLPCMH